uniref:Protein Wnt n=1 Tax=Thamnocephalus platyurus TaxID=91582 RepID=A0A0S1NF40_9CRUS|nr:Wnt7 ligand [Thamnocephalus platyurus]
MRCGPGLLSVIWLIVFSGFWCFSSVVAIGAHTLCKRFLGLTRKQQQMCARNPEVMFAVGGGAQVAIKECQEQFKNQRWNCSETPGKKAFGYVFPIGSREAAFAYGIWSAGVTHTITQECSKGKIPNCSCDTTKKGGSESQGWRWGGCSANVDFGVNFAKKFVDAREVEGDARSLMNLHNNRAGRKAVETNVITTCKCHGVSGSCTLRTCWQTLPPFREIGNYLKFRFEEARHVKPVRAKNRKKLALKIKSVNHLKKKKLKPSDLVYLSDSPNYCDYNPELGIHGTVGRQCNKTSNGADGCRILCCGRGYNTVVSVVKRQCECKFHWCCSVTCKVCTERVEEHYCK